ncbi:MAG: UvrD-helicase domain-containing protein [Desulfovibrio sp.]|nr:UvrD-helicase domain-containing protein [Desulfovibrio sp.]
MNFIADLHIHSRFSRATSKALTARHLAAWARCKGIHVLGTGDFTHPGWRAELAEQLERDESSGLYRLKGEPEKLEFLPESMSRPGMEATPLFLWQTEISSIYKRHGKVRKIHNLIFVPTLEDAERLSLRLAQVGNLCADGRPILGLDSRDLLEIMLDCVPGSVMIPAHVWTPWFALFGSKSGFNTLEECYADLSGHIFALETGLSSDPAMNRLVSALDKFALVSNSDAHSGANLGREANLFAGRPTFDGIFAALRAAARRDNQDGLDCRFLGTMEFYPDEGKYHLDGHRACNVVLEPREALELGNICPVCGKPLTVGVLHRVLELADRDAAPILQREPEARPLIPLAEITGEILGVGPSSRKVQQQYAKLLRDLGAELDILCRLPESDIRAYWEPLGEAVARMRRGQVYRQGGYDGEYGVVRVFSPKEMADLRGPVLPGLSPLDKKRSASNITSQNTLFSSAKHGHAVLSSTGANGQQCATRPSQMTVFSAEQQIALESGPGPVMVLAGPGAGKTRVLVGRLQHLMHDGMEPARLMTITFTRRAAAEIRERLLRSFPRRPAGELPLCDTLHAFAWRWLCETSATTPLLLGEDTAENLFRIANPQLDSKMARRLWKKYSLAREQGCLAQTDDMALAIANYTKFKKRGRLPHVDYADLLDWLLVKARSLPESQRPRHLLVDEVQDLSPIQLDIVRALLPPDGSGFFGIGDPDQSIYGFRGVNGQNEASLRVCWPNLVTLRLSNSYRASQKVLDMARSLLHGKGQCGPLTAVQTLSAELCLFSAPDTSTEAKWVADRIRELLGATSHTLLDQTSCHDPHGLAGNLAPGDIAILVRLKAQIPILRSSLERAGIPCTAPAEDSFLQDRVCAQLLSILATHCGFEGDIFHDKLVLSAEDPAIFPACVIPAGALSSPKAMEAWLYEQDWAGPTFTASRAWKDFCQLWRQCGSWSEFFQQIAWMHEEESVHAKAEHVQIMTLHASKGLEFQAVFIPGLEEGLLPLRRSRLMESTPSEEETPEERMAQDAEECRLLYVGLTRAARALFLSHCAHRTLYGRLMSLPPSSFLAQIQDFCRHSKLAVRTHRQQQQMSLL